MGAGDLRSEAMEPGSTVDVAVDDPTARRLEAAASALRLASELLLLAYTVDVLTNGAVGRRVGPPVRRATRIVTRRFRVERLYRQHAPWVVWEAAELVLDERDRQQREAA